MSFPTSNVKPQTLAFVSLRWDSTTLLTLERETQRDRENKLCIEYSD
jgi:hypothetical protein